jgi:hypothetical protein
MFMAAMARGEDSLAAARLAQRRLGEGAWSRVIRVENDGRSSRYPRIVHALVFELSGILWFYTAADGTQSFSLHRGRLEAEKADFGPLLRDIETGFRRWEVLADEPAPASSTDKLPNGCFVDAVAALRIQEARGVPVQRPRLLSYYFDPAARRPGHTVLVFEAVDGVRVLDPSRDRAPRLLPFRLARDPLTLARALDSAPIVTAREVPLERSPLPTRVARSEGSSLPVAGPDHGA